MKDYDNFFLPATDLADAKRFYGEVLGLPVKFEFAHLGMVAFKVGEQEPAIIVSTRPAAKPTIWFEVDDVRAEAQRLAVKGVRFLSEPFPIRTGMAVELEDPSGNRLGITDYSAAGASRDRP